MHADIRCIDGLQVEIDFVGARLQGFGIDLHPCGDVARPGRFDLDFAQVGDGRTRQTFDLVPNG